MTMLDVMALPDPLRRAMTQLMRRGVFSLDDLGAALDLEAAQAQELAEILVEKGLLRAEQPLALGEFTYRISLGRVRRRNAPVDL
jgi:hypothetical protein